MLSTPDAPLQLLPGAVRVQHARLLERPGTLMLEILILDAADVTVGSTAALLRDVKPDDPPLGVLLRRRTPAPMHVGRAESPKGETAIRVTAPEVTVAWFVGVSVRPVETTFSTCSTCWRVTVIWTDPAGTTLRGELAL